jgi:hypothetical protein
MGRVGIHSPQATVEIGYRRMLNLGNANDRGSFVINLEISSESFWRDASQIGISALPVLATLGLFRT